MVSLCSSPVSCNSSVVMVSQSLSSDPAADHRLSTRYAPCSWNCGERGRVDFWSSSSLWHNHGLFLSYMIHFPHESFLDSLPKSIFSGVRSKHTPIWTEKTDLDKKWYQVSKFRRWSYNKIRDAQKQNPRPKTKLRKLRQKMKTQNGLCVFVALHISTP